MAAMRFTIFGAALLLSLVLTWTAGGQDPAPVQSETCWLTIHYNVKTQANPEVVRHLEYKRSYSGPEEVQLCRDIGDEATHHHALVRAWILDGIRLLRRTSELGVLDVGSFYIETEVIHTRVSPVYQIPTDF